MMTEQQAQKFAVEWVAAWNAHDLDRVIAHYADNVEYHSPFLLKLTDNKTGELHGKDKVRSYLFKGLQAYPDLHFVLVKVFTGVGSITILYQSVNGLHAAEVFELNSEGLVCRVQCHYSPS